MSQTNTGRVEWIGVSSGNRATITPLQEVEILEGKGLTGDYHAKTRWSHRQVTLIQHDHLPEIARLHGTADVTPDKLRRNVAISGIDLSHFMRRRFRIGDVLLEGTGPCDPCNRMDENLGPGGKEAMKDKGGITARVLRGGMIRVGDAVTSPAEEAELAFPE